MPPPANEDQVAKDARSTTEAVIRLDERTRVIEADGRHTKADVAQLVKQVAKLETQKEEADRFREQQSATNKWLMGVIIGLVMGLLAMGVSFLTHPQK